MVLNDAHVLQNEPTSNGVGRCGPLKSDMLDRTLGRVGHGVLLVLGSAAHRPTPGLQSYVSVGRYPSTSGTERQGNSMFYTCLSIVLSMKQVRHYGREHNLRTSFIEDLSNLVESQTDKSSADQENKEGG